MFTLEDVRGITVPFGALLGIDTRYIDLKFGRGFRTAGKFEVRKKNGVEKLTIRINKVVFECCSASFFEIVRHEYAHAANYIINKDNSDAHGPKWRELCKKVGCSGAIHVIEGSDVSELLSEARKNYPKRKGSKEFNWDEYLEEIGKQFE